MHFFGKKDPPFIAIEVVNTQAKKYASEYPMGSIILLECLLMDDMMVSTPTIEQAYDIYVQVKDLLWTKCQMQIRKFATDSEELRAKIPDQEMAPSEHNDDSGAELIRTLGLTYVPTKDVHSFRYFLDMPEVWT